MKIKKFIIKECCGSTSVAIIISSPLSKDILSLFLSKGFNTQPQFEKAGIFYVENEGLIANGAFGNNKIQLKCRGSTKDNCKNYINSFQELLEKIG